MVRSLEINGSELKNIRSASELTGYSRDYITKLAREQKIIASQIGRQWFVDVESLSRYAKAVAEEQRLRNEQLSEERRRERQALQQQTVSKKSSSVKSATANRKKIRSTFSSQMVATGVLMIGLGFGFTLSQTPLFSTEFTTQVASTPLVQLIQGDPVQLAVQDESAVSSVTFSHESVGLSTMEGSEDGILLLPQQGEEIGNPAELFSDEVKVMVDENGNQFVARVDMSGNVVEKIPFVRVPVTPSNTP